MNIELAGVEFGDEGISVSYMRAPDDARLDGALLASHTLHIHAAHPNYVDEIHQIRTLVVALLEDALEDFAESAPVEPADIEDDDEKGMGE